MHLNVKFDYNSTSFSPPVIKVVVYNRPGGRSSWSHHGESVWYIGPDMEHYRHHKAYIAKKIREEI